MSNNSDDHPTEPLVPGMHAEPVEHPVGAAVHEMPQPADRAPSDAASDPHGLSLADAWSARRPSTFVGLVALGAVLVVALIAGSGIQATAASQLLSAVGVRIPGSAAQGHRLFGNPDHGSAPMDRNRRAPGRGNADPGQLGQVPGLPGLGRAEHGDVVLSGAGDARATTVRFARGQVTAVSTTALSLKCADGFTIDFAVNSDTKVRAGSRLAPGPHTMAPARPNGAAIADITVGDVVMAIGNVTGTTVTATLISLLGSEVQSSATPAPTGPTA